MYRVTVVIVNYRTLTLTKRCVESLRKYYPKVALILIDNGSGDKSTQYILELGRKDSHTRSILNGENLTHGPALHQGTCAAKTPYVFLLDSDSVVKHGNFLVAGLRAFKEDPLLYAVGHRDLVNDAGTAMKGVDRSNFIMHVHPAAMMIDREKYRQLPPLEYAGSPAVTNMRAVPERGWRLANFPIATYIRHLRGKTRVKFAGRWDPAYSHGRKKP